MTDYHINVFYSDEDGGYIADIPDLEACSAFGATAEEALIALMTTKQYYIAGPCHYLVGDSSGRGFVWEYSSIRNRHHVIECPGVPLPVTNHLLHEHHGFANTVALFQVSIALGAVSALTRNRLVWFGSMGVGLIGLALFAKTFLG